MAETNNCKKWHGLNYNNCFWIKNGDTAPCPRQWLTRTCIYDDPAESYEAFKKIWLTHYKTYPDYNLAKTWTGGYSVNTWLYNVNYYYNDIN